MNKKILGLVESIDDKNKIVNFLGYGEYLGQFPKPIEDFDDMTAETPKVKLDNGKEVWCDEVSFYSEKSSMEFTIADYKNRGYTINVV